MQGRYAVIYNGKIDNICLWDGATPWQPEVGDVVECGEGWAIGGTYENGVYTPPQPVIELDPNEV